MRIQRWAAILSAGLLLALAGCDDGSSIKTVGNEEEPSAPQIAAGGNHTCALLESGAVRCWGVGLAGRLGQDDTANIGDGVGDSIEAAGDVPLGGTAVQIAAGDSHTCALLAGGGVRCWGDGSFGRLGHGDTANIGDGVGDSIEAAGDVPLGGTAVRIATGSFHTCALLEGGGVRCWGNGSAGRLGHDAESHIGDGTGDSIVAAGDVPVGGTAVRIAAGGSHTCALLEGGGVRCWGFGSQGQTGYDDTAHIGDGTGETIIQAGDVPVGGTAIQIATGGNHTCALLENGAVRCWGTGGSGRLGHNAEDSIGDGTGDSIVAAGDVPVGGTVVQIAAGIGHTCALLEGGALRCWGFGTSGQLGQDDTAHIGDGTGETIIDAGDVPVGGTAVRIAAGGTHTCVLLEGGGVRCWGLGGFGQLGHDDTANIGDGAGETIIEAGDVPVE